MYLLTTERQHPLSRQTVTLCHNALLERIEITRPRERVAYVTITAAAARVELARSEVL